MSPESEPLFNTQDVRYLQRASEFTFEAREIISIKDHDILQSINKGNIKSSIPNYFYWSGSSFDGMTPLAFRRFKVNTGIVELTEFNSQEKLKENAKCKFF